MVHQPLTDSNYGETSEAQMLLLPEVWAKKYAGKMTACDQVLSQRALSHEQNDVVQTLNSALRLVSAQAWNKTESLLKYEIQRHTIAPDLIAPWQISKNIHQIFEKAIAAYADSLPPERLSVILSKDIGTICQ